MKTKTRNGFTLIEMLVVIAIVVLLIAIITPAVTSALGRARTLRVTSNLRQIGLGMQMFLLEHDGIYPVRFGDSVAYGRDMNGTSQHWQEQMDLYVGGTEAGAGFSTFDHARNDIWYSPNARRMGTQHFGLNANIAHNNMRYRQDRIPNPSSFVIVGEINANSSEFRPQSEPEFRGDTITHYRISNHGGVAVYLFADGHVESHKGNQGLDVNPTWYLWW